MSDRKRFIGRETELQFLENKYAENKGQLIVLYGRRRSGLFWNCLSARKKSWWLSMSFHTCAGIIAGFLRFCRICGMPS